MARAGVLVGRTLANAREVISLMADGEERLLIGTTRDGVLVSDGKTVREPSLQL